MLTKTQILIIFGLLVLSPWSSRITLDYMQLPLSLPEILFLPFLPYFINNYSFHNPFHKRSFIVMCIIWCVLLILGMMHSSAFPIISTSRTWLYIIIFFGIFSQNCSISFFDCYVISAGSILGWFSASIMNLRSSILNGVDMITYGPMLAIPICIVYGIVNKKRINSIIIVIITIIIGLTAGLRRELVVVLISCIFGWLIDLGQKMNKLIKQGLIGICLIIFMYPIYNNLSNIIKVNSPFIYYRIIDKTEKLLNGEGNEGDNHRLKLIVSLFTQYDRYLVPYGFINKQYIKNVKDTDVNGDYNDLPILELNRMLGSPLSTIIILYFVIAIICVLSKIRRNQISRDNIIIVVGGIIMLVLLFLEGSYFTFPYCAPYTGYILGKLQHESRLKIILHTNN